MPILNSYQKGKGGGGGDSGGTTPSGPDDFVSAASFDLTGNTLELTLSREEGGAVDAEVDLSTLTTGSDEFVNAAGFSLSSSNVLSMTLTKDDGSEVDATVDLSSLAGSSTDTQEAIGEAWATSRNIAGIAGTTNTSASDWTVTDGLPITVTADGNSANTVSGIIIPEVPPEGVIGLAIKVIKNGTEYYRNHYTWGDFIQPASTTNSDSQFRVYNDTPNGSHYIQFGAVFSSRNTAGLVTNAQGEEERLLAQGGDFIGWANLLGQGTTADITSLVVEIAPIYGGGGLVVANPGGSDGVALTRVTIRGQNYNLAVLPSDTEIGDKAFSNPPGDLTDAEKLAVWNAIDGGDHVENLIAVDTLVFYVAPGQYDEFAQLGYGTTAQIRYGTRNVDLTVLAAYRNGNAATLIFEPLSVWAGIRGEANFLIDLADGTQISGVLTSFEQTARTSVATPGQWFAALSVPVSGNESWRTLAEIENEGNTDLTIGSLTGTTLQVQSSTGTNATVPASTESTAGLESAAGKAKVNALPDKWSAGNWSVGSQVTWNKKLYDCIVERQSSDTNNPATDTTGWKLFAGGTNLSVANRTATGLDIASSTGDDASLPTASTTNAGLESATDKSQINASPEVWSAKVWAAGDQCVYDRKSYRCILARAVGDTTTPDSDTTGWAQLNTQAPIDLTPYVRTTTLASYSTTTAMNTAIANAVSDDVTDKGAYDATAAYAEHDLVTNDGGSYVALQTVAANTQTVTEPGSGTGWTAYWVRIGYTNGLPSAYTSASIADHTITLARNSGSNPTEIIIPGSASSNADEIRVESVAFQGAIAAATDFTAQPIATNPISVEFGSGSPEILSDINTNAFTVAAGSYIVEITATLIGTEGTRGYFNASLEETSGDTRLIYAAAPNIYDASTTETLLTRLDLETATEVEVKVERGNTSVAVFANWKVKFTRLAAATGFNPKTLGTDTFSLTGSACNSSTYG